MRRRGSRLRATRLPQALEAAEAWWKGGALVREADVVHIHSDAWMNQVAARLAARRSAYVLTHYGTEIWHHDGKDTVFPRSTARRGTDLYSEALLARTRELDVPMRAGSVVYPPVADTFRPLDGGERTRLRQALAPGSGPLLLNVKRLHPLADHATLIEAFAGSVSGARTRCCSSPAPARRRPASARSPRGSASAIRSACSASCPTRMSPGCRPRPTCSCCPPC